MPKSLLEEDAASWEFEKDSAELTRTESTPPLPPTTALTRNVSEPHQRSASHDNIDQMKSNSMYTTAGRYGSDGLEEIGFDGRASVKPMGGRPMGFDVVARVKRLERRERSLRRIVSPAQEPSPKPNRSFGFLKSSSFKTPRVVHEDTPLMDNKDHPDDEKLGGGDEYTKASVQEILFQMIFGRYISILLLFMPLGWCSHHYQWSPAMVFWFNFAAMIPLASILGDFTEEVAAHTNQVVGGLVNATFGNMVEVVVAIQALLANEIRVVQATLIGSIFSNLLLVLGCCFFFGGLYYKEQTFNSTAATANIGLLALSSIALVLPTPFAEYYDIQDEHVLAISRFAAVFLMFMYIQLLVFQLKTHAHVFEDEDDEQPELPMSISIIGLLSVTLIIAVFSDYLVSSIDAYCEDSGVSRTFVGLIILPIVGNAVEHLTAVSVAMKDKMDLAMGVSIGSCTQISLFVVPLTVMVGWMFDKNMTLNFPHFEIILYVMSVVTVSICLSNPKGNWLEGSLLITTYIMIAVGFWYENVVDF